MSTEDEEIEDVVEELLDEGESYEDAHGPDFSRMGTISQRKVEEAKERVNEMLAAVTEELERRGIPEPPRPNSHPKSLADTDITAMTNAEVANLYSQYVAYSSYIGDELAKIEGLEEMAKKLLRDTLAELKDAQFTKGVKGAEATAAATKDGLYRALDMEHMKLFFMKAIMKRRYKGYISNAAALSRTIELRKLDYESIRRDGNVGLGNNKRPAPRGFGPATPPAGTVKKPS